MDFTSVSSVQKYLCHRINLKQIDSFLKCMMQVKLGSKTKLSGKLGPVGDMKQKTKDKAF